MSMDEVLDCLEDQSELNILYHVSGIGAAPRQPALLRICQSGA